MSQRVLAVMLANGRQEMVQRAVGSFCQQTYRDRKLLIFDSGARSLPDMSIVGDGQTISDGFIHQVRYQPANPISIGALRNLANGLASPGALDCDLIAHFDSDDWSHPERLTEQVAMLEATGADCVGYRDMLFWDARPTVLHSAPMEYDPTPLAANERNVIVRGGGEAWQFRSPNPAYILGTSMLYTRKIWERFPFQDRAAGEDTLWLMERRIKRETTSSIDTASYAMFDGTLVMECPIPRMVAGLHDGNTCSVVKPGAAEWTRAERWDEFCRETMKL